MGLLNKKPKVNLEDFCTEFYNSTMLRGEVVGEKTMPAVWEGVFKTLVDGDRPFATVDRNLFIQEVTALRLELFALAWGKKFKKDKFRILQSIFTRHYLEKRGQSEIWEIMAAYNQAIADSVTLNANEERTRNRRVVKAILARDGMFNKWTRADVAIPSAPADEEESLTDSVSRVANRIGADVRQDEAVCTRQLVHRLADRLRCTPSPEVETTLMLLIMTAYGEANEAVNSVDLRI
jgi:hypothetical protein